MKYGRVAQVVEHLTFNQVVRGSNPRTLTMKNSRKRCICAVSWLFFIYLTVDNLKEFKGV